MNQKRGAPSKYESDVKPRFDEIREWLKVGATEKEIYKNLGICKDTWIKFKREHIELLDLIKNNRRNSVIKIKKAMLKRALGFQYTEKKVITSIIKLPEEAEEILKENGFKFINANRPQLVKTEVTTKVALPDPAAGLILLQHWDLDEKGKTKWSRDLASKELKEKELELKEKRLEEENW